jgi:integrase
MFFVMLCVFHDLRHSYAIHMLEKVEVSLTMVAKLLGDSIQVVEQYYAGFALGEEGLRSVDLLYKSSRPG